MFPCKVQSCIVRPLSKSVLLCYSLEHHEKSLLRQSLQFYVYCGFIMHQNQVTVLHSTDTRNYHVKENHTEMFPVTICMWNDSVCLVCLQLSHVPDMNDIIELHKFFPVNKLLAVYSELCK